MVGGLTGRWALLPPRSRRVIAAAVILIVGVPLAVMAAGRGMHWLAERSLRDQVALTATAGFWTSSTSPASGRIDLFVVVRNTGPRPVRIDSVLSVSARLAVRSLADLRYGVPPGETIDVPVTIMPACAASGPVAEPGPVRARIAVVALSGQRHTIDTPLAGAVLFAHQADNACRIRVR